MKQKKGLRNKILRGTLFTLLASGIAVGLEVQARVVVDVPLAEPVVLVRPVVPIYPYPPAPVMVQPSMYPAPVVEPMYPPVYSGPVEVVEPGLMVDEPFVEIGGGREFRRGYRGGGWHHGGHGRR